MIRDEVVLTEIMEQAGQKLLNREARGGRGVARDDQHLHPAVDQVVGDRQGMPADLRQRQRTVRAVRRVADVADLLAGQWVQDGPDDGQPAHAGVEDADRRVAVRLHVRRRYSGGFCGTV